MTSPDRVSPTILFLNVSPIFDLLYAAEDNSKAHAGAQQLRDDFTIFPLGEKACDAFRNFGTDIADFDED